jgi:hypothetical protein
MTSEGEELLAFQLKAAGIDYEREHRFFVHRRWRFDFVINGPWMVDAPLPNPRFAVEVEGGAWSGGHKRGKAADTDCEKQNQAALDGWPVFRFTPAMVKDGRALAMIEQALGR